LRTGTTSIIPRRQGATGSRRAGAHPGPKGD
jgi:hypothetical protein